MRDAGERTLRDIGENGRQPMDHSATFWDELRPASQKSLRPHQPPKRGDIANTNDPRRIASGQR